jgi:formate dehydrogenase major subunit/formate dehydrogenase alpha subunit
MRDVAENSQSIFLIGSNTTEQHPVFGAMIRRAVKNRNIKLIVADPRKIDMVEFASLHLQHRPGTDIALVNGLMYLILENNWQDQSFIDTRTEGYDEFISVVKQYSPEKVSEITEVPIDKLKRAAEIMGTTKPMAVIWAMGITQHIVGVRNVLTLANLQMVTGNMGIAGGGVNPLRGQNNVQGACDMGGLPNVYPAYQPVTNEESQRKFESAWGTKLDNKVGLTTTEMVPGILEDKIHALYILGEDPVMSDPDSSHIKHCLEKIDFLILQELFPSETSRYADVLLPGVTFAEKEGTFTNTERRVQKINKVIDPVGEGKPDWEIITGLAKRLLKGKNLAENAPYASWNYINARSIMDEINALTPSYAGITYDRLQSGEGLQWPCPSIEHPGTPILHINKFARGVGRFTPIDHISPAELPNDEYPWVMSTGRVLYHWHGGQMTRRSKGLMQIYDSALIEVNPDDAINLGLNGKNWVRISSRRGSIQAEALVTDRVPPGMIYANFHFPEASANELTQAVLDPVAKIPEYKITAVKIVSIKR